MIGLSACHAPAARPPTVHLDLSGSQLASDWVAGWLHEDPQGRFVVEKQWPMRVSQDGFDKLRTGQVQLACTDRPITTRELAAFTEAGLQVRGWRVAFHGYALYVHPSNRLDAIYAKHLELVLQKKITDWHELAGDAVPELQGPIHTYGLAKSTAAGMQLSYLARIWFDNATWTVLDSDQEIIARVAEDPLALGFAGLGYDQGVRYLALRMERTGPAALPSLEEIESERYGLAKLTYVYHLEPPTPEIQAMLDYLYSPAGQAAIAFAEGWPVPRARAEVRPTR